MTTTTKVTVNAKLAVVEIVIGVHGHGQRTTKKRRNPLNVQARIVWYSVHVLQLVHFDFLFCVS